MPIVHLLLGTNLGDKKKNLSDAIDLLEKNIGSVEQKSSLYRTAAWGNTNQGDFINQVVVLDSEHAPIDVLKVSLEIEKELGRVRFERWGARLIDIDLLYYDDQILNTDLLILPHSQIQNRRFTLVPLVELAPSFVHPVLNMTNLQLLNICSDTLEVEKI